MEERRLGGVISAVMEAKNFGYIAVGDKEYFFHQSMLEDPKLWDALDDDGLRLVRPGRNVSFVPLISARGNRAVGILLLSESGEEVLTAKPGPAGEVQGGSRVDQQE